MLVLAIDTTNEKGGVAIYRDSDCLAAVANEGPANVYSITLFQMVDRALAEAQARNAVPLRNLSDIEIFAAANGPGSFTGIRVGVAATQAWARAFGRPVRGVSVLEALAEQAKPESDWAVPIIDARRGEFFLGLFRRQLRQAATNRHSFGPEGEGWVLKPETLKTFLQGRLPMGATVTCLVREHDRTAWSLQESLPSSLTWQGVPGTLTQAIAQLALEAHREGRLQDPGELDACYIRRPDAEFNWKE